MSYGLQIFSPSGSKMFDTSLGALALVQVQLLPTSLSWSNSYPSLAGCTIGCQVFRTDLVNFNLDWAYPVVTITYPSGVPTVTVTKGGSVEGYSYYLIVFVSAGAPTAPASYGALIQSEITGVSIVQQGTKQLRFRAAAYPYHVASTPSGANIFAWHLSDAGIGLYEPLPLVYLELSTVAYASLYWGTRIDNGTGWTFTAIVSNGGYTPRVFIFSDDVDSQPIVDNQHGLAVYDQAGQVVLHSGRQVKLLQTALSQHIPDPPFAGSALLSNTHAIPPGAAAMYYGSTKLSGDIAYRTGLKLEGNTVRVGWFSMGSWDPDFLAAGVGTFINTANYL